MEWTEEKSLTIIDHYRKRPNLWNPQDANYFNRKLKKEAWQSLAEACGLSSAEGKKKIMCLLCSYRREKAKVKLNKKNLKRSSRPYTSRWFAYNAFSFLENRYTSTSTTKQQNNVTESDENSIVIENVVKIEPESFSSNQRLRCLSAEIQALNNDNVKIEQQSLVLNQTVRSSSVEIPNLNNDNVIPQTIEVMDTSNRPNTIYNDEVISFGTFISSKLHSYSDNTRKGVEHAIFEIIMKADRGHFE